MDNKLVPELHDIGKITDLEPRFHNFEKFGFSKHGIKCTSPSWQGILYHHCKSEAREDIDIELFPTTPETFTLCLADSLAAGVSRIALPRAKQRQIKSNTIQKVWKDVNPEYLKGITAIEAARFVETNPDIDIFLEKYGHLLEKRAEDANPGKDITSLFVHSILSGKFYRLLSSAHSLEKEDLGEALKVPENARKNINEFMKKIEQKWNLIVVKSKIYFSHKPFRTRELGIFQVIDEVLKKINEDFRDNIIFSSPDYLLLVLQDTDTKEKLEKIITNSGLWLEETWKNSKLSDLGAHGLEKLPGWKVAANYPSLNSEITPPLCENCQMDHATKSWPRDHLLQMDLCPTCKSMLASERWPVAGSKLCINDHQTLVEWLDVATEDLCQGCHEIRAKSGGLKKLAKWEDKVAWVRVFLDFDQLIYSLKELYGRYLKELGLPAERSEVRFSLLFEFQQDYNHFIEQVTSKVIDVFGGDNVECLLSNFLCVRLKKLNEVLKILRVFNEQMEEYFPKFYEISQSPIRLQISSSNAKFPFFEHWRILQSTQNYDVYINLVQKGEMKAFLKAVPEILARALPFRRRALHSLAEVAKISEQLAKVKFHDRTDRRDYKAYREIEDTLFPMGMGYGDILTLAKIVED